MASQHAQWCNGTVSCEPVPHDYRQLPTEVAAFVDLGPYYRVSGGDDRMETRSCAASPDTCPTAPSSAQA